MKKNQKSFGDYLQACAYDIITRIYNVVMLFPRLGLWIWKKSEPIKRFFKKIWQKAPY